jgi:salicylate hydroxylase
MATNRDHSNGAGEFLTTAKQSTRPLKITIAGAGLGGLFAAITLRNAGHHVEIYESSRFATETGAAIHLPPNVNGLLRRYGMIPEDHGANICEWVSQGKPNGEKYFSGDMRGLKYAFAYPWQLCHRIDLHNALKVIATREEGLGRPVVIHLQSKVVAVDVEKTTITLRDGTVVESNLIIGADGVHVSCSLLSMAKNRSDKTQSVVRNYVLGRQTIPHPSGTSAFRFLIPTSEIKADPKTAHFVEKTGEMTMLNGDERRIVMYPCRNNTDMNFVAMHPDVESDGSSQEWNQAGSIDVLLKVFDGFSDDVKAVLQKAHPDTVKLWKLLDHEALPTVSFLDSCS